MASSNGDNAEDPSLISKLFVDAFAAIRDMASWLQFSDIEVIDKRYGFRAGQSPQIYAIQTKLKDYADELGKMRVYQKDAESTRAKLLKLAEVCIQVIK